MKNVYGYIRVSTAKQGNGVSLEAQKEAIERYADKHNLKIIRWFEERVTASKKGRPLFLEMMALLHQQRADGAIIHKIDRSARNLGDWNDVSGIVDLYPDVDIHFAHEDVDLRTRGGRLSADVQAVMAADYSRNLRQETLKGLYTRLNQGVYPFGAPIGYINHGKGKLKTVDPIQSVLVVKAFNLYSSGKYTLRTLLKEMSSLGLRNVRGTKLCVNSLALMLNNPFYIGVLKVKQVLFNGKHQAIITPRLFKQVQSVLKRKTNQKVNKHEFVFSKRLKCHECGYSLIGEIQKGNIYYRCHTKTCSMKGVKESLVENQLKQVFSRIELNRIENQKLNQMLSQAEQEWSAKQEEIIASIKLQKGQIDLKLERLTDYYLEGELDKETYHTRKEKLLMEVKEKEAAENGLLKEKHKIFSKAQNFLELSTSLVKSYEMSLLQEKRTLIESTTSNLIMEGKKLVIAMRLPFSELYKSHKNTLCCLERDESRKDSGISINENTFSSKPKLLSDEALKNLLDKIFEVLTELPDNANEYDIP